MRWLTLERVRSASCGRFHKRTYKPYPDILKWERHRLQAFVCCPNQTIESDLHGRFLSFTAHNIQRPMPRGPHRNCFKLTTALLQLCLRALVRVIARLILCSLRPQQPRPLRKHRWCNRQTNEGKTGGLVFHHEQAQSPRWPSKLFFCCELAAAPGFVRIQ